MAFKQWRWWRRRATIDGVPSPTQFETKRNFSVCVFNQFSNKFVDLPNAISMFLLQSQFPAKKFVVKFLNLIEKLCVVLEVIYTQLSLLRRRRHCHCFAVRFDRESNAIFFLINLHFGIIFVSRCDVVPFFFWPFPLLLRNEPFEGGASQKCFFSFFSFFSMKIFRFAHFAHFSIRKRSQLFAVRFKTPRKLTSDFSISGTYIRLRRRRRREVAGCSKYETQGLSVDNETRSVECHSRIYLYDKLKCFYWIYFRRAAS